MSYPPPTEPLFTIHSDQVSTAEINRIAAIFPKSGEYLAKKRVRIVNKLSVLALDAARTTVPVRTEELRNQQVIRNFYASLSNPEAQIIVSSETHGSGTSIIAADVLSAILDRGWHQKVGQKRSRQYERSRDSQIENLSGINEYIYMPAGSPTKGWTKEAQKAYNRARRRLKSFV